MSTLGLRSRAEYRGLQRIGMPRALLYYRYGTMWTTFLREIGCEVITSDKTDKAIATAGDRLSIDECCLASKVYLGHVESLLDRCDAVFVPSVANLGNHLGFCTKFQALPDLVYNTFHDRSPSLVTYLVDVNTEKAKPHDSLIDLGQRFGVSPREAKRAFKTSYKAQLAADDARARAQDQMLATLHTAPASKTPAASTQGTSSAVSAEQPLAILLVAHPYVAHDAYVGGRVVELLRNLGTTVLFADETDRDRALKASFEFSETMPWIINRELIGSMTLLRPHIDGFVLVSSFPCGPDSMTDDAIMRCIQGRPILNLTIDAQSGTAGLETRVESFVDILRFQKRGGYFHG